MLQFLACLNFIAKYNFFGMGDFINDIFKEGSMSEHFLSLNESK
jgi:hypothetical protein